MHDLVIRNAIVVDGLGNDPVDADVAISNGRVTAIGQTKGGAVRTVDAAGLTLAPGIVDLHTHYDAPRHRRWALPVWSSVTADLGSCLPHRRCVILF